MKILFPTDFSEPAQNAFQHALLFADRTGADLWVLHVVYPVADTVDIPALAGEVVQKQVATAQDVMRDFVDNGRSRIGVKLLTQPNIHTSIEIGVPVSIIKKMVKKEGIDLIIMGTKGSHNNFEKLLGTVSTGVIAKAHCPILLIPEKAKTKSLHSIVYATDSNDADPFEIWKTAQLLAPVSTIFRVVHIVETKESPKKTDTFEKIKNYFDHHPVSIQMQFHSLEEKDVEAALRDFTEAYDADLLVMYRPQRSFLDQLFHRSHTKQMAQRTAIPLLVMKT